MTQILSTRILLLLGGLLVFGTVNWQVAGKERLRASGEPIFLPLAPRDPRSLMQGDYMALNFAVARSINYALETEHVPDGVHTAVLKLNPDRVADFVRLDDGAPLLAGDVRFRFRVRKRAVWLGTDAFFFHEGEETRYAGARFGEFRVNEAGDAMLVAVRGEHLKKM
jgi:uncharacterized membrane-anchored protein